MKNYTVTKMATKFGYGIGIFNIVVFALVGFAMGKLSGFFTGMLAGAFMAVPLMLFCEMCLAMVSIEENTRKENHNKHHNHKEAA